MLRALHENRWLNPARVLCLVSAAVLATGGPSRAMAQDPAPEAAPAGEQAVPAAEAPISPEQIAKLEKMLSGATLVGQFTVNGRGETRTSGERYELSSVKHMKGDMWLVTARIKYGERDVTVPLPLPIRWAGDTPVITLDKFTVPGMGAWSARVMFYDGRYMGYWFSAERPEHGGYLFGKIEPPKNDGEAVATPAAAAPEDAQE